MHLHRPVLAALIALGPIKLPLAAQGSVRNSLRVDLLGCYALFTGAGHRVDSSFYRASPHVRLDSAVYPVFVVPKELGARRRLARLDANGHHIDPSFGQGPVGPSWWVDSLIDSLRVSFSDGLSGAFVTVAAPPTHSDTLRGRIEEDWDYREPTSLGPAYAVRVACVE